METDRSDDSCCGRWTHYLAPKEVVGEDGTLQGALRVSLPLLPTHFSTLAAKTKANSNAANPRWTPEEDEQLRKLKTDDPRASWAAVGDGMNPKRSAGSCRARWVQHVQEKVTGAFSLCPLLACWLRGVELTTIAGIAPPKKSRQTDSPFGTPDLATSQQNAFASTSAAIPFQAPSPHRASAPRTIPLGPMLDPALMNAAYQLNESAVWSDGKGKAKDNGAFRLPSALPRSHTDARHSQHSALPKPVRPFSLQPATILSPIPTQANPLPRSPGLRKKRRAFSSS